MSREETAKRCTQWFARESSTIAFGLLLLWCALPIIIAIYDVITGFTGGFPVYENGIIHERNIYYPKAVEFYYRCFTVLGTFTQIFAVISIIFSRHRVINVHNLKTQPCLYLLGCLLLWSVICTLLSEDPVYEFLGENYLHDGLSSYFVYAGIFVCASMLRTDRYRKWVLRSYCLMVVILSTIVVARELGAIDLDFFFPSKRAAVFNQFNHFGYVLCMASIALAGLFLHDKSAKTPLRVGYLLAFSYVVYTLLINDTFGAFLATIAGLAFAYFFFIRSGNKVNLIALLPVIIFITLCTLALIGLLPPVTGLATNLSVFGTDLSNVFANTDASAHAGTGRMTLWRDTMQRIIERPVFGFGPEGLVGDHAISNGDSPHNEFLQIGAFLGIPGLLLYLSAIFSLAYKQIKQAKVLSPMVIVAIGATGTYLFSSCFGNPVFNSVPYFWLFFGMSTATNESVAPVVCPAESDQTAFTKQTSNVKFGIAVGALVVVAGLLVGIWTHLQKQTEGSYEVADLECMKAAALTGELQIKHGINEDVAQYWFDAGTYELIAEGDDVPTPYGFGTAMLGEGTKQFEPQSGYSFEYDESEDYTDKVIHVTINQTAPEGEQVKVEWRKAS